MSGAWEDVDGEWEISYWDGDDLHFTQHSRVIKQRLCNRSLPPGPPFYGHPCERYHTISEVIEKHHDGTEERCEVRAGCGYCHQSVDAMCEEGGEWEPLWHELMILS